MPPNNDRRPDPIRLQTGALVIISFAVVLFLLVQARFLLISLATAIILFSLTSDVINFIGRQRIGVIRIPNWLASIAALALIALMLFTAVSIILAQLNNVIVVALSYAERAPAAIASLFRWVGEDSEAAVLNSLRSIEVSGYVRTAAGQASNLMQAAVLITLFVGFLFAERVWFQTKLHNFIRDTEQAEKVGRIISSIIHRVNYYLLVKTGVSVATGLLVYFVANLFGLDLAVAIGLLTFVLNYLPSVGSIVATLMVALMAFVQTGDTTITAAIFVICGALQFAIGNVLDPLLMGRALRLSSFGIIISLVFWGAVWGIPGMFLAVPIMVMMLVVCSHVPALRPVAILLSREGLPETEADLDP